MLQHKHIIIRAEVKQPPQDIRKVKKWLRKLVKAIGMRPLGRPTAVYVNKEENKGITAVQCIETSHIALHCWDEVSPAIVQLDVYTCGTLDKEIVLLFLDEFDPVKVDHAIIDRADFIDIKKEKVERVKL
jgi:S-adenosylmethionine/arginine decarboxylase-like enzyme|tara:strand:- start:147 stop:536 length:390 start_codon:yes stop_codon:yes gene_type:complete